MLGTQQEKKNPSAFQLDNSAKDCVLQTWEEGRKVQVHNTLDCVIASFEVSNHFSVRSSETDKQDDWKTDYTMRAHGTPTSLRGNC